MFWRRKVMDHGPVRSSAAAAAPAAPAAPAAAAALAALGLLLAVPACTGGDEDAIGIGTVARRTVNEVVEAPGTVTARASATLTAPATGTVQQLSVVDGQPVTAGKVVLVIDAPAAEEQLRQARLADEQATQAARAGRVAVPGADLSGLQRSADRAAHRAFTAARKAAGQIPDTRLRTAALAELARAEAEYAAAGAQAQAAVGRFTAGLGSLSDALASLSGAQRVQTRAAVAVAERTVDALTVRAPIDGVVALGSGAGGSGADVSGLLGQLPPEAQGQASQLLGGSGGLADGGGGTGAGTGSALAEGTPVQSGATLLTITDVSELSLTAEVDETDVLLVAPGVSAEVELDAVPGATYDAKVRSVDISPTTSARGGVSYSVRLTLGGGQDADGDPAPRPRPGMSAVVGLQVRSVPDAVAVPSSAVVRDGSRDTLWVVESGQARRRSVRLGAEGDAFVEVREGVRPGDRVVIRGAERVRQGQELP
jgi:HlyD family secretion protein